MTHALAFALGLLLGASLRAWWAYGAGWDAALEYELPPEPDDIDWLGEHDASTAGSPITRSFRWTELPDATSNASSGVGRPAYWRN